MRKCHLLLSTGLLAGLASVAQAQSSPNTAPTPAPGAAQLPDAQSTTTAASPQTPPPGSAPADAAPASPGAPGSGGIQDIVVTAQRRSENTQKVALAIDTVGGGDLAKRGIIDPAGLTTLVPSVQFGKAAGPYYVFFLRGVGSNASSSLTDTAVSLSLDGVPLARQYNTDGQFYDLERVEILEGPQGTLYGRNATGGAINLIPQHPKHEFSADGGVSFGNYDAIQTNAALNVPLTDTIAARASFQSVYHRGYLSDGEADQDDQSARLQVLFDPSSAFSVLLSGDYVHQGGRGGGSALGDPNADVSARIGQADPIAQAQYTAKGLVPFTADTLYQDNRYSGLKGEFNWKSDLGTLTIIPAYRHARLDFSAAFGGGEKDLETDNQESVEARFASNDRGFLRWIVGGYYLHDSVDADFRIDNRNNASGNQQIYNVFTDSKAVFADITAHLSDRLRLIGGIRYTDETKGLNGSLHNPFVLVNPVYIRVNDEAHASKVTWRAGAEYDVAPASMLYATVSTGFRSGGFYFTADNPAFAPETITAYTIGSKNRFFNNKLQANLELFDWEYRNQQLAYTARDSQGNVVFATANAGSTQVRGVELDLKYQIERTTQIGLNVQFLDSHFQSFLIHQTSAALAGSLCTSTATPTIGGFNINCTGLRPPESPKWVLNPTASHDFELQSGALVNLLLGAHYQSGIYTALNFVPSDYQGQYVTGNASVTFTPPDKRWTAGAFVENITDIAIKQFTTHTNFNNSTLQPPRTYGVRASVHF